MIPNGEPSFFDLFGRAPDATARAPGRVNLIGEHTDYSGGFVLPMATPQGTQVEVARRQDRTVVAWSMDVREGGESMTYRLGEERRLGVWIDYVQGATAALRGDAIEISGFDARICSDLPLGGGLSSSASLLVSLLRALREAMALPIDDLKLALLAKRAENDLVGAPVGVMDQMAASLARGSSALFIDTRSLAYELIPMPEAAALVVVDSGISHAHAGGEYRARREECERAAALLGVKQLRDLVLDDLPRVMALPEPLGRRARHVVTEDERVILAVAALRAADLPGLGALFDASHASMRDDFQVTTPDIDLLAELIRREPGVHGARMTGGGFGGCVIGLADRGAERAAGERAAKAYSDRTGHKGRLLIPTP